MSKLYPRRYSSLVNAAPEPIVLTDQNPLCYLMEQVNDWFGAAKKTLLSNANKLLQDMQEYDKDNIPDKVIAVRSTCRNHVPQLFCEMPFGQRLFRLTDFDVSRVRSDPVSRSIAKTTYQQTHRREYIAPLRCRAPS